MAELDQYRGVYSICIHYATDRSPKISATLRYNIHGFGTFELIKSSYKERYINRWSTAVVDKQV